MGLKPFEQEWNRNEGKKINLKICEKSSGKKVIEKIEPEITTPKKRMLDLGKKINLGKGIDLGKAINLGKPIDLGKELDLGV